jgi:hypothetical protein
MEQIDVQEFDLRISHLIADCTLHSVPPSNLCQSIWV